RKLLIVGIKSVDILRNLHAILSPISPDTSYASLKSSSLDLTIYKMSCSELDEVKGTCKKLVTAGSYTFYALRKVVFILQLHFSLSFGLIHGRSPLHINKLCFCSSGFMMEPRLSLCLQ